MKTFNEVELHLLTNGYKSCDIDKICGYLIGAGVKDTDTEVTFLIGDGVFDDFYAWFNDVDESCSEGGCTETECVLCGIIRDIALRMEAATDQKEKDYYFEQLEFLLDAFDLDEDDGE